MLKVSLSQKTILSSLLERAKQPEFFRLFRRSFCEIATSFMNKNSQIEMLSFTLIPSQISSFELLRRDEICCFLHIDIFFAVDLSSRLENGRSQPSRHRSAACGRAASGGSGLCRKGLCMARILCCAPLGRREESQCQPF